MLFPLWLLILLSAHHAYGCGRLQEQTGSASAGTDEKSEWFKRYNVFFRVNNYNTQNPAIGRSLT